MVRSREGSGVLNKTPSKDGKADKRLRRIGRNRKEKIVKEKVWNEL